MSAIEAALAAIDVLEPGEKINYTKISNQYGVVRSTLTRRHQRLLTTRELEGQNRRALHPHQEQELLQYIERLIRHGLPSTRPIIRRFASDIAK